MIILPTSFCPSVGYLALIAAAEDKGETVSIDHGEQYQKQTLRNRAVFMTASGLAPFTIPVAKYGYPAPPVSEILISEHGDWRHKLKHALRSGYGTSPFWVQYEREIRSLTFDDESTVLIEYNLRWLRWMMSKWGLETEIAFGSEEQGDRYTLEELSKADGGRYWQVFETRYGYISGLSSLDLLLCEGPYAIVYLKELGQKLLRSE